MPKNRMFFVVAIPDTRGTAESMTREFNAALNSSIPVGSDVHFLGAVAVPANGRVLCIFREYDPKDRTK